MSPDEKREHLDHADRLALLLAHERGQRIGAQLDLLNREQALALADHVALQQRIKAEYGLADADSVNLETGAITRASQPAQPSA